MTRLFAVLSIAFLLASCATPPTPQQQADVLVSLTPEHFRDTAAITDDNLETIATISMANGYQDHTDVGNSPRHSVFLRALVTKKTGDVTYQVYVYVDYFGPQWRFFDTVNFQFDGDIKTEDLTVLDRHVDGCGYVLGCEYEETVGFMVSTELVQQLAKTYTPNGHNPWLFKLRSRVAGDDWEDGIMPAEAAGLLMAVNAYKVTRTPH